MQCELHRLKSLHTIMRFRNVLQVPITHVLYVTASVNKA